MQKSAASIRFWHTATIVLAMFIASQLLPRTKRESWSPSMTTAFVAPTSVSVRSIRLCASRRITARSGRKRSKLPMEWAEMRMFLVWALVILHFVWIAKAAEACSLQSAESASIPMAQPRIDPSLQGRLLQMADILGVLLKTLRLSSGERKAHFSKRPKMTMEWAFLLGQASLAAERFCKAVSRKSATTIVYMQPCFCVAQD